MTRRMRKELKRMTSVAPYWARRLGVERLENRFPLDGSGGLSSELIPFEQVRNDPTVDIWQIHSSTAIESHEVNQPVELLQQNETTFDLVLGSTESILNGAMSASIVIDFNARELSDAGWLNPVWQLAEETLDSSIAQEIWTRQFLTNKPVSNLASSLIEFDRNDSSMMESTPQDTRFLIRLGSATNDVFTEEESDSELISDGADVADPQVTRLVLQFISSASGNSFNFANYDSSSILNSSPSGTISDPQNIVSVDGSPSRVSLNEISSETAKSSNGSESDRPRSNNQPPSHAQQPTIDPTPANHEGGIELPRTLLRSPITLGQLDPITNPTLVRNYEYASATSAISRYAVSTSNPQSSWNLEREIQREIIWTIAALSNRAAAVPGPIDSLTKSMLDQPNAIHRSVSDPLLNPQTNQDDPDSIDTMDAESLVPVGTERGSSIAKSTSFVFHRDRTSEGAIEPNGGQRSQLFELGSIAWLLGSIWKWRWEGTMAATAITLGLFCKRGIRILESEKEKSAELFSWDWISRIDSKDSSTLLHIPVLDNNPECSPLFVDGGK